MYWVERKRHNTLAEYAFYKNYFDRFTADLAFYYNDEPSCKKPNYKRFYTEPKLNDKKIVLYNKNSDSN